MMSVRTPMRGTAGVVSSAVAMLLRRRQSGALGGGENVRRDRVRESIVCKADGFLEDRGSSGGDGRTVHLHRGRQPIARGGCEVYEPAARAARAGDVERLPHRQQPAEVEIQPGDAKAAVLMPGGVE